MNLELNFSDEKSSRMVADAIITKGELYAIWLSRTVYKNSLIARDPNFLSHR